MTTNMSSDTDGEDSEFDPTDVATWPSYDPLHNSTVHIQAPHIPASIMEDAKVSDMAVENRCFENYDGQIRFADKGVRPTSTQALIHVLGDDEDPLVVMQDMLNEHVDFTECDCENLELDEDVEKEAEQLIEDMPNEGEKQVFESLRDMREIIVERDGSGNPHDIHAVIAEFWSTYLGSEVSGQDVARMMALLKIARAIEGDGNRDNDLDGGNYMAIAASMWDDE